MKLKATKKIFCAQYYRRAQRRNSYVRKTKALRQTRASESPLHKLYTETIFFWLKQDECIELKGKQLKQQQQNENHLLARHQLSCAFKKKKKK